MNNVQFKARYRGIIAQKYLDENDRITITDVWQILDATQKQQMNRLVERKDWSRFGKAVETVRKNIAIAQADARIDVIVADGAVSILNELDEIIE